MQFEVARALSESGAPRYGARAGQSADLTMGKLKDLILHEAKLVALITAYFLACFATIGLLKKLFLAEYDVEFAGVAKAAIAALVIAKVVIVLDKTRLGNRFERHSVWSSVLYKSFVYSLFTAGVLVLEKLFHAWREGAEYGRVLGEALASADSNRALATTICVFVSFIGYNLLSEIGRLVGWDRLLAFLFERHEKPSATD
jgi:hypothetical protein